MHFGLTNTPATFQALMNEIFKPHSTRSMLVFFYDILVYSSSMKEHVQHLQIVFAILETNQLYANRKKCCFGQHELENLGHAISREGVAANKSKIAAMLDWPSPQNLRERRGFLSLTGYYRKFVANYGAIAWLLTKQLKDNFGWTKAAEEAFLRLEQAMTMVPMLALLDFSQPFMLETNASGYGLGTVLMQNHDLWPFSVMFCHHKHG